jgi:hypothetical protein
LAQRSRNAQNLLVYSRFASAAASSSAPRPSSFSPPVVLLVLVLAAAAVLLVLVLVPVLMPAAGMLSFGSPFGIGQLTCHHNC